jgi:hypothetical protein
LGSMPNRRAASRWLSPSTWQAYRTLGVTQRGLGCLQHRADTDDEQTPFTRI